MPPPGLRCPGCGSSNIIDDDLHCQTQLVCVDCGAVVSEGTLVNDVVGGADVSYSQTTAVARKPCPNLLYGIQRVRAICRSLRVNHEIETLSQTNFTQAYQHEHFINVSLQRKEVLGGCCVLVSCRLLNWPITMGTISCLLDADPMVVGAIYKEMVQTLNITAPTISITDVMEAHSQEYKISPLDAPEELSADPRQLNKRAVALVELAADTWIVTGRQPVPIMMSAIYLAWQSLKPTKQRLKLTLEKFCKIAKVNKHKVAMKRVAEMKEVLCKLGKELPWIREDVTPENVVRHVEDILQHRFALLRRAMRTHEETRLEEGRTSGEDSLNEKSAPSEIPEIQNSSSAERCEIRTDVSEQPGDGDDNPYTVPEPHGSLQGDQEPNWGKRALFAPPCVVHPKKRKAPHPESKEVTGDEEICDIEIDSYIRTPREVREFTLVQQMLSEKEDANVSH
ncbi:transcription factor IIIB 50 kDa subunit [Pleuronectes platessa]|uniref:transcription factor IIIB 50 kDa subunit n=1 Tax=Pleuronectes platessa TaxID=8262 RepID=UPI00232A0F79|nr:transcription factor IIIB 50 kDa subunit [Pleuronectes platessa]